MLVCEEIGRTEELKRRKEVGNKTLQHTIITSNPNNLPILSPNTPSTPTTPTKPQISIVFLWFVIFPSFPPFWDFRFFFVVVFIFLSLSFLLPSFYPFLGPNFAFFLSFLSYIFAFSFILSSCPSISMNFLSVPFFLSLFSVLSSQHFFHFLFFYVRYLFLVVFLFVFFFFSLFFLVLYSSVSPVYVDLCGGIGRHSILVQSPRVHVLQGAF